MQEISTHFLYSLTINRNILNLVSVGKVIKKYPHTFIYVFIKNKSRKMKKSQLIQIKQHHYHLVHGLPPSVPKLTFAVATYQNSYWISGKLLYKWLHVHPYLKFTIQLSNILSQRIYILENNFFDIKWVGSSSKNCDQSPLQNP